MLFRIASRYLPPPLFAASMRAVWNTVLGQGRGTKLSESPITENTMVGVTLTASLISSHTFLIQLYINYLRLIY